MKTTFEFGDKVSFLDDGRLVTARVCGHYTEGGNVVLQLYRETIDGRPAHGRSIEGAGFCTKL